MMTDAKIEDKEKAKKWTLLQHDESMMAQAMMVFLMADLRL
jgi:hypothetical protein